MAQGKLVRVEKDDTYAYAWVSVAGDWAPDATVATEYAGKTPLLKPDGTPKTNAELKVNLIAACKATRDAMRSRRIHISAVSGDVEM